MSDKTIQDIREDGEKFLPVLQEEFYQNLAGFKRQSSLRSIYDEYPDLGEAELFRSLGVPNSEQDENVDASNTVALLRRFLADAVVGFRTAEISDEILETELREAIEAEIGKFSYRAAFREIKNEYKKSRRKEIDDKRARIVSKLNPLLTRMLDTIREASDELGFSSYLSLCSDVGVIPVPYEHKKQAEIFLNDTDYIYRDLLAWFLSTRMEIELEDATKPDLLYLLNSFELEGYFPKTDLIDLGKAFLGEMGIETEENIKIDASERREKKDGPNFFPINPPDIIATSFHPVGGVQDYESFLFCLGKGLSYGFVSRDDDFEFRFLRESPLKHLFGQLFRNLVYEPKWLEKYLDSYVTGDFLIFLYLRRLAFARYEAGRLIYEISLHEDQQTRDKPELYKQILEEATLSEIREVDYLADIYPFLGSAISFRASIIEAALSYQIKEKFDEEWWRVVEAGDFFFKIWEKGGRVTRDEIYRKVQIGSIDLTWLIRVFEEVLG